jgi:hypothetical protein
MVSRSILVSFLSVEEEGEFEREVGAAPPSQKLSVTN